MGTTPNLISKETNMQLLNPNVFFVAVPTLDPQLPGVFMRPAHWQRGSARDTTGVLVPFRSQAEAYAVKNGKA
jgi:hypothetical protein